MMMNDKRFHMRFPSELYEKLEIESKKKYISVSALIRMICQEHFNEVLRDYSEESEV